MDGRRTAEGRSDREQSFRRRASGRRDGGGVRRPRGAAGRARARARQHLPREAHRADEGDGHLRAGHPRAVRRGAGLDAVLRAGHRRAGPRLDEPGRRDGRPHRGRQAAAGLRHRRAEAALPARDGDRRGPRDDGAHRARRRLGPAGHHAPRARPRRRRLRRQRRQDLDHQRPPLPADRPAVQDRPGRAAAAQGHQHPAGRARPTGSTVSRDLPKLGYKGVESCELSFDDYRVPADALLGGEPRATASPR